MGVPTIKVEIAFPTDVLDVPDSTEFNQQPSSVAGLIGWYDFSDPTTLWEDAARTDPVDIDTDAIAGVTDKSSSGFHLAQTVAASRAAYRTGVLNGKSVARFDGVDDTISTFAITTLQPYTIYAVAKADIATIASDQGIVSGEAETPSIYLDSATDRYAYKAGTAQVGSVAMNTSFRVLEAVFNGASSLFYVDGTLASSGNPGSDGFATGTHRTRIGSACDAAATPIEFFDGDVAEVILYNRALTAMERRIIERYLALKYALTIPGADWTDVSAYVRSVQISRGKDHELNRSQAGQCTVTLSNLDRRFDPTHAASPYAPYVIPMRQIRVSAVWSAVTYNLFTGFIEDWGQAWLPRPIKASGDAEARVRAVDGFKVLSLYEMAGSGLYSEAVLADNPQDYWKLEEAAGSGTVADSGTYNNALTVNGAQATLGVASSPLAGPKGVADIISVGNTPLRDASAAGWTDENTLAVYGIACDFWIKVDAYPVGNAVGLVSITGASGGAGIMLAMLNAEGRILHGWREHASGSPGQERFTASTGVVPLGVWTHVGTTRVGTLGMYWFNGEFDSQTDFTGAYPYSSIIGGQTPTIVVGAEEDEAGTDFFDGKLAHVAVYANYGVQGESFTAHASATLQGSGTTDTAGAQIGFLLDAVGWPASRRVVATGDSDMGDLSVSGSILESILAIGEDAEQGRVSMSNGGSLYFISRSAVLEPLLIATFSDTGSDTRYTEMELRYDDQDLYTRIIVQANFEGASEQVAVGATVGKYGPRTLRMTGVHLGSNAEAANLANFLAIRYDEAEVRVTRIALPMVADADWPAILQAEPFGHRVALVRTPPGGGSAISKNAHVEGLQWNIVPADGVWQPTFNLVPAFEEEFWIMGTSAFDDETVFVW
jgi:hypothetical protein